MSLIFTVLLLLLCRSCVDTGVAFGCDARIVAGGCGDVGVKGISIIISNIVVDVIVIGLVVYIRYVI